jgi:type III secretory pathway component EscT
MRGQHLHAHRWIATLGILLVIGAHVALVGFAAGLPFWALLAAGAIGMAGLKYGWSRLRR